MEKALHILLVEDNTFNQKVIIRLLEKLGYTVAIATNGRESLAALDAHPYPIILMDIQMPEMDGLEATRQIRSTKPDAQQPWIIALTGHATEEDKNRCIESGMNDYISKPIQAERLQEVLQTAIQHLNL
jgi:CheY-like chemotaxis protein